MFMAIDFHLSLFVAELRIYFVLAFVSEAAMRYLIVV